MIIRTIRQLFDINSIVNEIDSQNSRIKSDFVKKVALVVSMHANCEHYYEHVSIDFENKKSETFGFDSIEDFNRSQKSAIDSISGSEFKIKYEYEVNGNKYTSSTISPVRSAGDSETFKKISVGDKVAVFVNPNNPNEAYIRPSKKNDFIVNKFILAKSDLLDLALKVSVIACVILVISFF